MTKRSLSAAERELFETAMDDSTPLKKATRLHQKRAAKLPARAKATEKIVKPETLPPHVRRTVGIDGNTAERLRRGQLEPQARLDLHGMSERDAHRAVVTFVRAAKARRLRLLLVVTGKGVRGTRREKADAPFDLGLNMQTRGILRTLTPRWLREPGLAEMVAETREAHRRHGGSGALYVYLRKADPR